MEKNFFVYILTNKKYGVLYVGVTSNLPARIQQHLAKTYDGFSAKYNLTQLVYYEDCGNAETAITREKQLKAWKRDWKIELIDEFNPSWNDLGDLIMR